MLLVRRGPFWMGSPGRGDPAPGRRIAGEREGGEPRQVSGVVQGRGPAAPGVSRRLLHRPSRSDQCPLRTLRRRYVPQHHRRSRGMPGWVFPPATGKWEKTQGRAGALPAARAPRRPAASCGRGLLAGRRGLLQVGGQAAAHGSRVGEGRPGRRRPPIPLGRRLECDPRQRRHGHEGTRPVGGYPPGASPYGVHDMSGNVFEWVGDWYDPAYYGAGAERNPRGPASGQQRTLRGGGWHSGPIAMRTVSRGSGMPTSGTTTRASGAQRDYPDP